MKNIIVFIGSNSVIALITLIWTSVYDKINKQKILTSFYDLMNTKLNLWVVIVIYLLFSLFVLAFLSIKKKVYDPKKSKSVEIVCNYINKLDDILPLNNWNTFSDNTLRGLVEHGFIDIQAVYNDLILTAIWPKYFQRIRKRYILTNKAYNDYVEYFSKHCYLDQSIYREDKFYKSNGFNENYDEDLAKFNKWQKNCFVKFHNFVFNLNRLIKMVNSQIPKNKIRNNLHKMYVLNDAMGVWSNMKPTLYLPMKKMKEEKDD